MRVVVEPARVAFEVEDGETIFAAALRSGLTWPTICGGQGACTTCVCLILEGHEHLSAIAPREAASLHKVAETLPDNGNGWRLACQTSVTADIRLRKIGVRRLDGIGKAERAR